MLKEAAENSVSYAGVLRFLGIKQSGGSHCHIKKMMAKFEINTSHFTGRVMQTFLPYESFQRSLEVLDYRRLGKQRVEARQLIDTILGVPTKSGKPRTGWLNHPAAVMWRDHVCALMFYHNMAIDEWVRRGYNNTMPKIATDPYKLTYPDWLGDEAFHASHRSNLLRKDPEYYGQFGWTESDDLEYVWPK